MIISMKLHSTRKEIDEVTAIVSHYGYKVHSIEGEERVVIGVVGVGDVTACMESVEAMAQVEKVVRITAPYKFVSKEFRPGKTRIKVDGGAEIGGEPGARIALQRGLPESLLIPIGRGVKAALPADERQEENSTCGPRQSQPRWQRREFRRRAVDGIGAILFQLQDELRRRAASRTIRRWRHIDG